MELFTNFYISIFDLLDLEEGISEGIEGVLRRKNMETQYT